MADENVQVVLSAHEAFARGDLDGFLSFIDPDVEFTSLVVEAEAGGAFAGHAGVRRWAQVVSDAFGGFHAEVESARALDPQRVVAKLRMSGVARGIEVRQTMWQGAIVRDGKLVRWAIFRTEEDAVEAARSWETGPATSPGNVEIAWRAVEAFNDAFAGADEAFFEFLDADVEWAPITTHLDGRTYRGPEQVREWIADLRRDWDVYELKWDEIRDLDDERVLAIGSWHARGRRSGVELQLEQAAWVATIRAGKLSRVQTFTDRAAALEAAAPRD